MRVLLGCVTALIFSETYAAAQPANRVEATERELATLEKCCRNMLTMQTAVRNGVVSLQKRIDYNLDRKPTHSDRRAAVKLAREQAAIVREATRVLKMLEADSAVAFPEVFRQLRDDMKRAQLRLKTGDIVRARRNIEDDAIEVLQEMLSALRKGHTCG